MTLDIFEEVPGNAKALKAARAYAVNPRGLVFCGPSGGGKTHLAAGLVVRLISAGHPCKFLSVPSFLETLRQMTRQGEEPDFRRLTSPDICAVLVLDDIGAENSTDWTIDRLYLIINERIRNQAPVVYTTNHRLDVLRDRIGDRIVSRMERECDIYTVAPRKAVKP